MLEESPNNECSLKKDWMKSVQGLNILVGYPLDALCKRLDIKFILFPNNNFN
jgi:hypothetical protein